MSSPKVRRARLAALIIPLVAAIAVLVISLGGDDDQGGDGGSPPTTRHGPADVTLADNGGEVTVKVDEPFVLFLQGTPDSAWGPPEAEAASLALTGSSLEVDGSLSATYVADETAPGVVVRARRTGTITEAFAVTIRVVE